MQNIYLYSESEYDKRHVIQRQFSFDKEVNPDTMGHISY
jgi:hypothetical protein